MDLLSKTTLATIMWLTILMGKPFALQYAQKDAPKERWGDQKFIQGCRFISLTWAYLMSLSVGLSILRRSSLLNLPEWVYFDASLCIILTGLAITTLFKARKRTRTGSSEKPKGSLNRACQTRQAHGGEVK
jgi:cytochrome bd-type quinol oxidase subunit 2